MSQIRLYDSSKKAGLDRMFEAGLLAALSVIRAYSKEDAIKVLENAIGKTSSHGTGQYGDH